MEGSDADGMTHTVKGALSMRGVTNTVTVPMKLSVSDGSATGTAEFAINRQDWKIAYPGKPDDLIQDNVVITVDFVAEEPSS